MKKLMGSFLLILILLGQVNAALADVPTKALNPCIVKTHCFLFELKLEPDILDQSFQKAENIIRDTPRTIIVEKNTNYIHAEATTKWMRYIDDLEVKKISNKNLIQIRSESRVGVGDMGVNEKRVKRLIYKISQN